MNKFKLLFLFSFILNIYLLHHYVTIDTPAKVHLQEIAISKSAVSDVIDQEPFHDDGDDDIEGSIDTYEYGGIYRSEYEIIEELFGNEIEGPPRPKNLPPSPVYYFVQIKKGETFSEAMLKLSGVSGSMVYSVVEALKGIYSFRMSRRGHSFIVTLSPDKKKLLSFTYRINRLLSYDVKLQKDGSLKGKKTEIKTDTKIVYLEGDLKGSVYQTIISIGETGYLANEFMKMFAYDIDFFSESREHDSFGILVEKEYVDGEFMRYGNVLYGFYEGKIARFNEGYHFTSKDGEIDGYYDKRGRYTKKVMLRTPLETCHETSGYGWRIHPITRRRQFHNGIDYRGPIGTPVYSVADGVVLFAGRKGKSGKLVVVKHQEVNLTSVYAHLSRIYVRRGQRVKQRKTIGAVGNSGRSSGPHLHFGLYEGRYVFARKNKHINPNKKNLVPRLRLQRRYMSEFKRFVHKIDNLKKKRKRTVHG